MSDSNYNDIHRDVAEIKKNVSTILLTLRGPLGRPDQGIVSMVLDHEQTHRQVRKVLWASLLALATGLGTLAIDLLRHFT